MSKIERVLFTGRTHTGASRRDRANGSHHGNLDIQLSSTGGNEDSGQLFTNVQAHPMAEQLFAGAWSACFTAAIGVVAGKQKVTLPLTMAVDIEVDLGQTGQEYLLQARLNISLPGVPQEVAEAIVHEAHEICPYSTATRGNIEVALNVITAEQ